MPIMGDALKGAPWEKAGGTAFLRRGPIGDYAEPKERARET